MAEPIEFDNLDSAKDYILHLLRAYKVFLSEVDPLRKNTSLAAMSMGFYYDPFLRDIALGGYLAQIYGELGEQEREVWGRTVGSAAKELGFDVSYGSTVIPMIITMEVESIHFETTYYVDLEHPEKGIYERVRLRKPNLLGRILGPSAGELGYTTEEIDITLLEII